MNLVVSITPILVVMIGMVVLKIPARYVSPVALIYTLILGVFYFATDNATLYSQTVGGIISGAKVVYLIFSAFLVLNMLLATGAMEKIKEIIADLTDDRRKQVIIVAYGFGALLEGFAGAGSPAAICAPFLVGLGINPMMATTAALICNGVPSSWGAAGLSTVGGFEAYKDTMSILSISGATGRIHIAGAIVVPWIVIMVLYGRKALKGMAPFLLTVGITSSIAIFIVSNFIGPEFTSIINGLLTIAMATLFVKKVKSETPSEFVFRLDPDREKSTMPALKALATYIILLVALPVVRFFGPQWFIDLGFAVWIGTVIVCVCVAGSIVLGCTHEMPKYIWKSFVSVISALISLCALTALANIMKVTGMLSIIAKALADVAGGLYPALAVVIGSVGSFMTGTTLGSNIMFSPLHLEASQLIGVNPFVVFGAQNAGGALGNMICPNNVVAVCTTVGVKEEGLVMRKVLAPICILWVIYGIMALLNAYIFSTNFGVWL